VQEGHLLQRASSLLIRLCWQLLHHLFCVLHENVPPQRGTFVRCAQTSCCSLILALHQRRDLTRWPALADGARGVAV
jgi:hypothetical protein